MNDCCVYLVGSKRYGKAHECGSDGSCHVELALHVDQGVVHPQARQVKQVQVQAQQRIPVFKKQNLRAMNAAVTAFIGVGCN